MGQFLLCKCLKLWCLGQKLQKKALSSIFWLDLSPFVHSGKIWEQSYFYPRFLCPETFHYLQYTSDSPLYSLYLSECPGRKEPSKQSFSEHEFIPISSIGCSQSPIVTPFAKVCVLFMGVTEKSCHTRWCYVTSGRHTGSSQISWALISQSIPNIAIIAWWKCKQKFEAIQWHKNTTQTQKTLLSWYCLLIMDTMLLTLFTNVVFLLLAAVCVDRVGNFSSLCTD